MQGITLQKAVKMGIRFFEQLAPGVPLLLVKASNQGDIPLVEPQEVVSIFPNLVDTDEVALGEKVLTDYVSPRAIILPISKTHRNTSSMITLGRGENNDIRILDPRISKTHCYFLAPSNKNSPWRLLDLDSTNGTFLEGRRLNYGQPGAVYPYREMVFSHVSAVFLQIEDLTSISNYAKDLWAQASGAGPLFESGINPDLSQLNETQETIFDADDDDGSRSTQRLRPD